MIKNKTTRPRPKRKQSDAAETITQFFEEWIAENRIAHNELVMELRQLRHAAQMLHQEMKQSGSAHNRQLFWELIRERDENRWELENFRKGFKTAEVKTTEDERPRANGVDS